MNLAWVRVQWNHAIHKQPPRAYCTMGDFMHWAVRQWKESWSETGTIYKYYIWSETGSVPDARKHHSKTLNYANN